MFAIFKKEIGSYFSSPIGYIYLAVFYLFAGISFYGNNLSINSAEIEYTFLGLFQIVLFVLPLLTMKILSDEKRLKTDQALFTSPVSLFSVVMGKYLAALVMFGLGLLIMFVFAFVIFIFMPVDWMVFFANLIGLLLLGAALLAIGIFISSLTESQVVSAIASFATMMLLFMLDTILEFIPVDWIVALLSPLSLYTHYTTFTYGYISVPDVVFFLSVATIFIFLTIRVIDKRRWS